MPHRSNSLRLPCQVSASKGVYRKIRNDRVTLSTSVKHGHEKIFECANVSYHELFVRGLEVLYTEGALLFAKTKFVEKTDIRDKCIARALEDLDGQRIHNEIDVTIKGTKIHLSKTGKTHDQIALEVRDFMVFCMKDGNVHYSQRDIIITDEGIDSVSLAA